MVTSEPNSAEPTNDQTDWSVELDRFSQLLETLLVEFARLNNENRRLQTSLGRSPSDEQSQLADVLEQIDNERRSWEDQKQAIADRIESILGKFQWLEAERAARAKATADV